MALLCKLGLSECDGCGRCFGEEALIDDYIYRDEEETDDLKGSDTA